MIRGVGNVAVAVVLASLLDKYLYAGRYADAAVSMVRQIRHSLGW
jgi:hypothetical protein